MPVKIKGSKATKASKENASTKHKDNAKTGRDLKPPRKVLGDITNSASDDNASILTPEKLLTNNLPVKNLQKEFKPKNVKAIERPRRARRVPTRYKEDNVSIDNLSPKKSCSPTVCTKKSPIQKVAVVILTPLKSSIKKHDSSLIINRPRRICRLPSKFDDNFTSPNKFLPGQPINSSTPLAVKTKNVSQGLEKLSSKIVSEKKSTLRKAITTKVSKRKCNVTQSTPSNKSPKQSQITNYLKKKTATTNKNAKNNSLKSLQKSPVKTCGINNSKTGGSKIKEQDFSFRILDDRKSLKRNSNKLDVYEFTFDPSEEPPPAKKQKKKNVKKSKPKKVTFKSNYEKNLAKALAALRNAVAPEPVSDKIDKKFDDPVNKIRSDNNASSKQETRNKKEGPVNQTLNQGDLTNHTLNQDVVAIENVNNKNYNSVRVEDIALDIQPDGDNLNYSPVNTPHRLKASVECMEGRNMSNVDPLNLQDKLSFFDDQPAASSSMNQSIRHPLASPWRAEFGSLPIKWQVNTYVKPNMTPALESSFINFNDSKKRHVYTSLVPPANDTLPEIVENPILKQTSIISFIKEVVERSANKKKKKVSPVKNNSLFEDLSKSYINTENSPIKETSKKTKPTVTPSKGVPSQNIEVNINTSADSSADNMENAAHMNENDKNITYFGFDEDQENTSPTKKRGRSARLRTRRVLQELNTLKGPTRPVLPVAAKTKILHNFDKVNELYENMKSATEPPAFPEMSIAGNTEVTGVGHTMPPDDNEDSQSVHLFEDIEIHHHHKPIRKSYSKPKRVMFKQKAVVDSDGSIISDEENKEMSGEDEMDESFILPTVELKKATKKRVTKKKKLSKKEKKEVEAWAAGFNSMCEDIEEFDLVVE